MTRRPLLLAATWRVLLLVAALALFYVDAAQLPLNARDREDTSVVTLAGSGSAGSADNVNPASATFNFPVALTLTQTGDILVADTENNKLRLISRATGAVTTVAGVGTLGDTNGACSTAAFSFPIGLASDDRFNGAYVADLGSNMIREVDLAGTCSVRTVSGNDAPGARVDGNRAGSGAIASTTCTPTFTPSCNPCSWVGVYKSWESRNFFDGSDYLYHFNPRESQQQVVQNNKFGSSWGTEDNYNIQNIDVDSRQLFDIRVTATGFDSQVEGNAWHTYAHRRSPFEDHYSSNDHASVTVRRCTTPATRATGQAQFTAPAGIVRLRGSGDLLVTEKFGHAVRRVSLTGLSVVDTVAGGSADPGFVDHTNPLTARFNAPLGIVELADDSVVVADEWNYRLRGVASGTYSVTTLAGGGTCAYVDHSSPLTARFCRPKGLAVDRDGVIYVADYANHRIRRVDPVSWAVTTVAGTGVRGATDDATDALQATFDYPAGLSYDRFGHNILIADQVGHKVRALRLPIQLPTPTVTSPTVSASLSKTPVPSASATPSSTATATASGTNYPTLTRTDTYTMSATQSGTPLATPSASPSGVASRTITFTPPRSSSVSVSAATSSRSTSMSLTPIPTVSRAATPTPYDMSFTGTHTQTVTSVTRSATASRTLGTASISGTVTVSGRSETQSRSAETPSGSTTVSVSGSTTHSASGRTETLTPSLGTKSASLFGMSRSLTTSFSRGTVSKSASVNTASSTSTLTPSHTDVMTRSRSHSINSKDGLLQITTPVVDFSSLLLDEVLDANGTSMSMAGSAAGNRSIDVEIEVQAPWRLRRALEVVPGEAWLQQRTAEHSSLACVTVEIGNASTANVTDLSLDLFSRHVTVRAVNTTGLLVTFYAHAKPTSLSRRTFSGFEVVITAESKCFNPDVFTTPARIRTFARDPAKPKTAIEKTTEQAQVGVDTVTVVSSLSGSPGGAIAAQRLGSLAADCQSGDETPEAVPRAMNPTQAYVGDSHVRYYLGAALINPVVAVGIVLLHLGASGAYGRFSGKPLRQSILILRLTSGICALFLIASQPTLEAAAVVLSQAFVGPTIGAAIVTILFVIFASLVTYRYLWKDFAAAFAAGAKANDDGTVTLRKEDPSDAAHPLLEDANRAGGSGSDGNVVQQHASEEEENKKPTTFVGRIKAGVIAVVTPSGEWLIGDMTVEALCDTHAGPAIYRTALALPLYMDYNARGKYFMIVEFFVSAFTGLATAVELFVGCKPGSISVLVVLLMYVILLFAMRPHAIPIDAVLAFALGIGQLMAASARVYFIMSDQPVTGQSALSGMIFVLQICAIMRGAFDFFNFCRKMRHFFDSERKRKLQAAAAAAASDEGYAGGTRKRDANTLDGLMATWNDDDDEGNKDASNGGHAAIVLTRDADMDEDDAGGAHYEEVDGQEEDEQLNDVDAEDEDGHDEEVVDDDGDSAIPLLPVRCARDELLDALLEADGDMLRAAHEGDKAAGSVEARAERRFRRRQRRLAEGILNLSSSSDEDGSDDGSTTTSSTDSLVAGSRRTVVFGMLQSAGATRRRRRGRRHGRDEEVDDSRVHGAEAPEALRNQLSQALARQVSHAHDPRVTETEEATSTSPATQDVTAAVADALDDLLVGPADTDAELRVFGLDGDGLPTPPGMPDGGDVALPPMPGAAGAAESQHDAHLDTGWLESLTLRPPADEAGCDEPHPTSLPTAAPDFSIL